MSAVGNIAMAETLASTPAANPSAKVAQVTGVRKNGKDWHQAKKAFRPTAGQTAYAKRVARESQVKEIKATEKEMKAEKEEERQVRGNLGCISAIC